MGTHSFVSTFILYSDNKSLESRVFLTCFEFKFGGQVWYCEVKRFGMQPHCIKCGKGNKAMKINVGKGA